MGSWGILEWVLTSMVTGLGGITFRLFNHGGRLSALEARGDGQKQRVDDILKSVEKMEEMFMEYSKNMGIVVDAHKDLHAMTENLAALSQVLRDFGGEIETVRSDVAELRGKVLGTLEKALDKSVSRAELQAEIRVINAQFDAINKEIVAMMK